MTPKTALRFLRRNAEKIQACRERETGKSLLKRAAQAEKVLAKQGKQEEGNS